MKALGIDYGTARIGLAISDDLGMLAHPLETVPGHNSDAAAERIGSVVSDRNVEAVVIGLPLHSGGEEGKAVLRVRKFTQLLKSALPENVPIHEVDERFTTVSAMEKLHEAGRNTRNSKSIIDQAAAIEILQQWLDSQAGDDLLPPPPDWAPDSP